VVRLGFCAVGGSVLRGGMKGVLEALCVVLWMLVVLVLVVFCFVL